MAKPSQAAPRAAKASTDKDAPLKEDIRLLGRLLGDVLREQEGDAVFAVVETIRQTAVRFRRESDPQSGADLNKLLKKLTRDQTISVVRAFPIFRTWPTLPKTSTTTGAAAPTCWPAPNRNRAASPMRSPSSAMQALPAALSARS